jgi:hypothetical protein
VLADLAWSARRPRHVVHVCRRPCAGLGNCGRHTRSARRPHKVCVLPGKRGCIRFLAGTLLVPLLVSAYWMYNEWSVINNLRHQQPNAGRNDSIEAISCRLIIHKHNQFHSVPNHDCSWTAEVTKLGPNDQTRHAVGWKGGATVQGHSPNSLARGGQDRQGTAKVRFQYDEFFCAYAVREREKEAKCIHPPPPTTPSFSALAAVTHGINLRLVIYMAPPGWTAWSRDSLQYIPEK